MPPTKSKAKVTLQDGSYKEETNGNAQADTDAATDADDAARALYAYLAAVPKMGKVFS